MAKVKQGSLVEVTERTHYGTRTILGSVTRGLVEEVEGEEVMTHITVTGMVTVAHIGGLPLPVEVEEPITLTMIPAEPRHPHLMTVTILEA